jgi:hypothetical protein
MKCHIVYMSIYVLFKILPFFSFKTCFRRTVRDSQTGQDVVLCDADVDIIQRLQAQKIPDAKFDDVAVSTDNIPIIFVYSQLLVFILSTSFVMY